MTRKIFVLIGLMAATTFVLAKGCGGGGGGAQETNCTDNIDNDDDNYTDCQDSDCAHAPECQGGNEICNNGQDDDGDGFADCSDADCANDPACTGSGESNCGDGIDNDGDGYTDCADVADCAQNQACQNTEAGQCNDSIDNDNDSYTDCADADCLSDPVCSGQTEVGHCNDGIDNDNDGFMDCQDHADCDNDPACQGGTCDSPEDMVNQVGCPGQNCTIIDAQNNIGCADQGTHQFYEDCSDQAGCLAGSECMTGGNESLCMPFCDLTLGQCPGNGLCLYSFATANGDVGLCVLPDQCDLLTSATCDAGEACYIASQQYDTHCVTAGTIAGGQSCTYSNDCIAAYGCLGNPGVCVELCDTGSPNCTAGTCTSLGAPAPNAHVGACQ